MSKTSLSKNTVILKLLIVLTMGMAVHSVPYSNVLSLKGVLEMVNKIRANPANYVDRVKTIWKANMTGCV
jgi:hypothetical protein